MDKRIFVEQEGMEKLRKAFGVSRQTIWKALTYQTQSAIANKIRHTAMTQCDGVRKSADSLECETTHEELERTMTQRWGERVKLVVYKESGDVELWIDGKMERREENMTLPAFVELQIEAEMKAQGL